MDHYSHLIAGVDFMNDDDCFFFKVNIFYWQGCLVVWCCRAVDPLYS